MDLLFKKSPMKKGSLLKIQTKKEKLRIHLLECRKAIPVGRKKQASYVADRILSQKTNSNTKVLSYCAKEDELNLSTFNEKLQKQKRLFLPKVKGNHLEVYQIVDQSQLKPGAFGIMEPNLSNDHSISISSIDYIIVPALGLDDKGKRIGYGKGYYDKLLATVSNAITIGITFKELRLTNCPTELHDQDIDCVYFF